MLQEKVASSPLRRGRWAGAALAAGGALLLVGVAAGWGRLPATARVGPAAAARFGGSLEGPEAGVHAASQAGGNAPSPPAGAPQTTRSQPRPPLPPLPVSPLPPPRPYDVVRAAYVFAAEHPEILAYVPCFCGCEANGHRSNLDCFVATRDRTGHVTWNAHGMG